MHSGAKLSKDQSPYRDRKLSLVPSALSQLRSCKLRETVKCVLITHLKRLPDQVWGRGSSKIDKTTKARTCTKEMQRNLGVPSSTFEHPVFTRTKLSPPRSQKKSLGIS